MSWSVIECDFDPLGTGERICLILPDGDEQEHLRYCEEGPKIMVAGQMRSDIRCDCFCKPEIRYEELNILVIHNSADGREAVEQVNDILKNI